MARRRVRVWQFPTAIEAEYRKEMRAFVRILAAETLIEFGPAIAATTAEAYSFRPDQDQSDILYQAVAHGSYYSRILDSAQRLVQKMGAQAEKLWGLAKNFGRKTEVFNKKQMDLSVRSALGVDVFKSEPWLLPELRAFEAENLRLIKSIPARHVEKVQGKITEALRRGDSTASIMKEIQAVASVTSAQAELIAADQIGKLNAQLTRQRQMGIGVKTAKWRGVLDRRERPTHRALEGVEFSWKNPPLGGPGFEIRCRCWAEAVFPELKDIEGVISP